MSISKFKKINLNKRAVPCQMLGIGWEKQGSSKALSLGAH